MAEPYQPVPTATPEAAPARPMHIQSNAEMFGASVGTALEGVGANLEHASNELYSTAIKFRQLDIENEVNGATTDLLKQNGDLDNKFRLMEGSDPQRNLQAHVDQLEQNRQSIRAGLSSDFARKMFDRETMRRLGYDIVNAGNYAATQARQANKNQRQATIDATIDSLTRDPMNDQGISDGLQKIVSIAGQDSVEAGDSKPVVQAKTQVALGRAIDAVAKSIAKVDPDRAKSFLEKFKDYTHTAQYQQTMDAVEERGLRVRAEMEAARIATPLDPILDRAMQVTKDQESRGSYTNVTTTKDKNGNPQSALGAYGIMDRNLPEWSRQVLGHEVTKEEFLNSPQIQDQIYRAKMGEYIRKYGVEGAGRAWLGGEGAVVPSADNRKDAFGTKVVDYGKVFAAKVGLTTPQVGERGVQQMMQDAETSANLYYPDDPIRRQQYLDTLQKAIVSKSSVQNRERVERMTSLRNSLQDTVNKQMPNGRGPTSFTEAGMLDPHFADNFEELNRLDPRTQDRMQQAFIKNAKADVPDTPERRNNYVRYVGMQDEEFMQQDFNKAFNNGEITLTHANQLNERQANIKRRAFRGVAADSVLSQNSSVLNDARIFRSQTDSAANKRYQQFRGALIEKMEEYATEHNASMPQKEADETVKNLLKEIVTGPGMFGGLFGPTREPQYQAMSNAKLITTTDEYNKLPVGGYYLSVGADGRQRLRQKPDVGTTGGP